MEKFSLKTRVKSRARSQATQMRVGYYIRVSTEEQAENPEGSIKNQEERLHLALRLKNTDGVFGVLAGIYCDAGRSGKDMNRPELQRLLKDIETGQVNLVMVSELSRLSRSIKDFSQIWEFMQSYDCGFLSLRENFDTSNAAGEMMLYSIANFAQFERRQTSERVSANFLARAQRGLWNGGVLPLGYEPDPAQVGNLKIVDEEAIVVRAAFQALSHEGSVSQAAKWLNQNNYSFRAPLRGGGARPRLKHFTFDSLYRLLSNPAYAGIRKFKTKDGLKTVKAVWPAMIEPEIFERAHQLLEAGRKQKTGRESRYPYLLSTRITCAECGCTLVGLSAHGNTTKVPYYAHSSQIKREQQLKTRAQRCTPFRVSGKKIEAAVWKEVLILMESETHRASIFQAIERLQAKSLGQTEDIKRELALQATAEKLANLAHRIAELPKGVPADAFYDEMKNLAEKKSRLEAETLRQGRTALAQELVTEGKYERLLARLRDQLIDLSPESKRRIIHALVHKIVVTRNGFDLQFYVGVDQIKTGEALASPSFSLSKKLFVSGSFKHLNGAGKRT